MTDPAARHSPETALVTGAGRGLGRALSLELARRGLRVAALGRSGADLDALAAEAPAGAILPVICDLEDIAALRRAFGQVGEAFGGLHLLINNAAVYPQRDILEETPESFSQTVAVNLGGTVACSLLALEGMTAQGWGRIVNVTSFADIRPVPRSSAYAVSKGAGRILTRAMVADLGPRFPDIVISDWAPGALRTRMGLPDGTDPAEAAVWGANLALQTERSFNGAVFAQNRETLPGQPRLRRFLGKLTGRGPVARVLD